MQDYANRFAEIVHPVYVAQGWTWGFDGIIPSRENIAETARYLAGVLEAEDCGITSTGRIICADDELSSCGYTFSLEVNTDA